MHKTTFVISAFIAAVLAGLLLRFAPRLPGVRENFMQKPVGMPLDAPGMGPYDGVGDVTRGSEPAPITGNLPGTSDPTPLLFLADNKRSPECGSIFSSDTGPVCLTDADKKLMASRGGNK